MCRPIPQLKQEWVKAKVGKYINSTQSHITTLYKGKSPPHIATHHFYAFNITSPNSSTYNLTYASQSLPWCPPRALFCRSQVKVVKVRGWSHSLLNWRHLWEWGYPTVILPFKHIRTLPLWLKEGKPGADPSVLGRYIPNLEIQGLQRALGP